MPVLRHAIPDHCAIQRAQGRKQRRRAVALVVVRHGAAAARLQRQTRLGSVEGLNLALLIHAQHQRLVGRVQVKADHIGELFDELGIAAHLEGRRSGGACKSCCFQIRRDGRFADPLGFGHHPRAPVGGVRRWAVQGGFDNRGALRVADRRNAARTRRVLLQAGGAQGQKPLPPQLHGRPRDAHPYGDVLVLHSRRRPAR